MKYRITVVSDGFWLICMYLQDSKDIPEEPRGVTHTKLFSHLLSIARRHEGYQTLWDVSCDLNDSVLLRSLMV